MICPYLRIASPSLTGRTANLCPMLDRGSARGSVAAVEGDVGAGGDGPAADGDVVLGTEVDGKLDQGHGGHCGGSWM